MVPAPVQLVADGISMAASNSGSPGRKEPAAGGSGGSGHGAGVRGMDLRGIGASRRRDLKEEEEEHGHPRAWTRLREYSGGRR